MSTRNIKKINLDFNKTIPYFKEHIACGNTLSEKVIEKNDFSNGNFFTLLPEDAVLTRLYEFAAGGIIPPIPYGDKEYFVEGLSEPFHPQQVITIKYELSEFIKFYLDKQFKNSTIVENVILEPESLHVNIKNVETIHFNKEVYYYLNDTNSIDDILETITYSDEIWHFLAVLTVLENKPTSFLENKDFDEICDHIKFIIAGAYDGEGYIFWEKA